MIIESSKDILFLTIALSIFLFTVFACWAVYYVIVMLKNISKMTISAREKLELVDKILKLIKDKLEKGSNHAAMISDSVIKLVGFLMEKQKNSGPANKKRRK
ncbi:MAG: hypothetical protein HUU49_02450 [Candidatus Buchananbacteria bacterium]|nr:hypothetical protein [Candidatus Buchananbacteria bacterium]